MGKLLTDIDDLTFVNPDLVEKDLLVEWWKGKGQDDVDPERLFNWDDNIAWIFITSV